MSKVAFYLRLFAIIYCLGTLNLQAQNYVAQNVIGAPNFTTQGTKNYGSIAIDAATGKIFVSDGSAVYRFASTAAFANNVLPEATFSFTQNANAINIRNGNLWVVNSFVNRVVMYKNIATVASINSDAPNLILGQPNSTTFTEGVENNQLYAPMETVFIGNQLFILDSGNDRILRFDNIDAAVTGQAASKVFGGSGTSNMKLNNPYHICADNSNNLWVIELGNKRIVRIPNVISSTFGAVAMDKVLGQSGFTQNTVYPAAANSIQGSGRLAYANNTLFVSSGTENRILIFEGANTIANFGAATKVIGQPNFTSKVAGLTATSMNYPGGMAFIGNSLLVAEWENKRVVRYSLPTVLPVGLKQLNASLKNNLLKVNWQTASEQNNKYFEIQIAENGSDWKTVGTVVSRAPSGTSTSNLTYSFSTALANLALAGFGLMGILLLPAVRHKFARLAMVLFALVILDSCAKDFRGDNDFKEFSKSGKKVYVRLAQVDLNGDINYSETVIAK